MLIIVCFLVACSQKQAKQVLSQKEHKITSESAININSASKKELETLPNIGEKTAQKIIEHREKFGHFRKPEHLLLVNGISDKRFRELRNMVKTE